MAYRVHVIPKKNRRKIRATETLKAPSPYGLEVIESCLTCQLRNDRLYCDLPHGALVGLDSISSPATYPKGAILFVEGQEPRVRGVKLVAATASGRFDTALFRF
jgi:hypothetical protein